MWCGSNYSHVDVFTEAWGGKLRSKSSKTFMQIKAAHFFVYTEDLKRGRIFLMTKKQIKTKHWAWMETLSRSKLEKIKCGWELRTENRELGLNWERFENYRVEGIFFLSPFFYTHKQGNEHHKVRQPAPLRKPSHTAAGRRWKHRVFPLGSSSRYFSALADTDFS